MEIRDLPQSQRDRLAFIELRTRFFGEIQRQDIISRFGIQVAAATRDLTLYRNLAPGNLEYNAKERVYKQGRDFLPNFEFSAERVLTWLSRGYGDGYPEQERPLVRSASFGPVHSISLFTLSVLTQAIYKKKAVEMSYRSMTSGLSTREFVPFALADNGFRWHVRGFDRKNKGFIDLILTRIMEAHIINGEIDELETSDQDIQWNRIVELELVPHPDNVKYAATVEADYGLTDGVLKLKVRAALVGYLLRRWSVDCSPDHSSRGHEFHLWLRNSPALYGVDNLHLAPGYVGGG